MKKKKRLLIMFFIIIILSGCANLDSGESTREHVLTTGFLDGKLVFIGIGGDISGVTNPTLTAQPEETITVTLINGGIAEHEISFPELRVSSKRVSKKGEKVSITFTVPSQNVVINYVDSLHNHDELGMQGYLAVGDVDFSKPEYFSIIESPTTSGTAVIDVLANGGCGSCHVIPNVPGATGIVGPDLSEIGNVVEARISSGEYSGEADNSRDYLLESIREPDVYLSPDCHGTPCPPGLMSPLLADQFSEQELTQIIDYLAALPDGLDAPLEEDIPKDEPHDSAESPLLGNAAWGKQLFTGEAAFINGGVPCMGCHTAGNVGGLGGGNLGPDLSKAHSKFGEEGLAASIQNVTFPTMVGVYAESPLTPPEVAHLTAFFAAVDNGVEGGNGDQITIAYWIIGGIGVIILFGVMGLFWPRQRENLTDKLRKQAGITSRRRS